MIIPKSENVLGMSNLYNNHENNNIYFAQAFCKNYRKHNRNNIQTR